LDWENPFTLVKLPKIKLQFIVIIIVCLFSGLYGTLLLEYDAKGGIEWDQLLRSPHIFTHQIFPPPMWPHTDMIFINCFVGALSLYVALIASPTMQSQYLMYKTGDNRILMEDKCVFLLCWRFSNFIGLNLFVSVMPDEISKKMLKFRSIVKMNQIKLSIFLTATIMVYYYIIIYINNVFTLSLTSILFWLLLFPILIHCLIYGLYP